MTRGNENPFADRTPENMEPAKIAALFEDVFMDIPLVNQRGHTFINGPRGSGKSMMLKYMLPEVQKSLVSQMNKEFTIGDLDNYCFYFGARSNTIKDLFELKIQDDTYITLAHHLISIQLMDTIIRSFRNSITLGIIEEDKFNSSGFYEKFIELCMGYGISIVSDESLSKIENIEKTISKEIAAFNSFSRRLSISGASKGISEYSLGVTTFLDFIYPLLEIAVRFSSPHFFIMIDDADELNDRIQKIINTWVSYRTNKILSLKISTQMRYGNYKTISDSIIETPHDFNLVDLSQIYTSKNAIYFQRIKRIVEKRLHYYGIDKDSEEYFPNDREQELAIKIEGEKIKGEYYSGIRKISSRLNDDIYRYAIPNYMVSLAERKKSNLFSYSGFRNLVNISSGVVRFFLEPASQMYNKQLQESRTENEYVSEIKPAIQNEISRSWSINFANSEIHELVTHYKESPEEVEQLINMINGLGKLFTRKLLDRDATERRVFSISTTRLPKDLEKVVQLGVSYGYFQRSTIRSKESTGIRNEIILSRRLAPHFYLDPSGYSGRLSITIPDLRKSTIDPDAFVTMRLRKGKKPLFSENTERLFPLLESDDIE